MAPFVFFAKRTFRQRQDGKETERRETEKVKLKRRKLFEKIVGFHGGFGNNNF